MSRFMWTVFVVAICSVSVLAQVPVNPTAIAFDHTDYGVTDSYSVGYFSSATATVPVQEAAFPKPATCAPCGGNLPSRPTAFQAWWVGVRAIAGSATSGWSNFAPFIRGPLVPTNVTVK